jgi:hypothetical protein
MEQLLDAYRFGGSDPWRFGIPSDPAFPAGTAGFVPARTFAPWNGNTQLVVGATSRLIWRKTGSIDPLDTYVSNGNRFTAPAGVTKVNVAFRVSFRKIFTSSPDFQARAFLTTNGVSRAVSPIATLVGASTTQFPVYGQARAVPILAGQFLELWAENVSGSQPGYAGGDDITWIDIWWLA